MDKKNITKEYPVITTRDLGMATLLSEFKKLDVRSTSPAHMLFELELKSNPKAKEQWDKGYKEYNKAGERGNR